MTTLSTIRFRRWISAIALTLAFGCGSKQSYHRPDYYTSSSLPVTKESSADLIARVYACDDGTVIVTEAIGEQTQLCLRTSVDAYVLQVDPDESEKTYALNDLRLRPTSNGIFYETSRKKRNCTLNVSATRSETALQRDIDVVGQGPNASWQLYLGDRRMRLDLGQSPEVYGRDSKTPDPYDNTKVVYEVSRGGIHAVLTVAQASCTLDSDADAYPLRVTFSDSSRKLNGCGYEPQPVPGVVPDCPFM